MLGNYLPRQCGIATFTSDLTQALGATLPTVITDVVAMNDRDDYVYSDTVKLQIDEDDYEAYRPAAAFLNQGGYDVLSVQHEYGIFGGDAGSNLLTLLREVKMPIVTTLHTVLQDPTTAQRAVTDELLQLSERVIVMSELAVEILTSQYSLPVDCIDLIPHGIPDFHHSSKSDIKDGLDIKGPMILTFGLLSPDKGIQFAIQAMPKILAQDPGAVYVILGATHPTVRAAAGEAYRDSLVALAEDLGVNASVRFVDSFVSEDELVEYLKAADIYVTPYLNPQQITSGTLAYALGAGKVVVSTPYVYARELLADGRGILVPFRDADAVAESILRVKTQDGLAKSMGQCASAFCKRMRWPEVGASYASVLERAVRDSSSRLRMLVDAQARRSGELKLPHLSTSHLLTLTDDTGILQHAAYTVPNRSHGYCVDDNARALLLTALLDGDKGLSPILLSLQSRYLSFVQHSFDEGNGRFRNFMSYSREWHSGQGSDDSHARALWALGAVVHRSTSIGHRRLARDLFRQGVSAVHSMTSPRAWAYASLAADEYLHTCPAEHHAHNLREQMGMRLWREYQTHCGDDWRWFEDVVAYANARLSQALIVTGQWLGNHAMLESGLESLEWLMEHQVGPDGFFSPIGSNGFWKRGGERASFDQQPLEAWAAVSACICAAKATGDDLWMSKAQTAFRWFLGGNDLGQAPYDLVSGGCRDGLHEGTMNENQGAESTLSFLCALAEMQAALISQAVPRASELLF